MADISVRPLTNAEWELFRSVRLRALEESPEAFVAEHASEAVEDDEFWHARMRRSLRLVAEVEGQPVGTVSLGPVAERPEAGQIFGLWVDPTLRGSGIATALVRAGVDEAAKAGKAHVVYWVGTDNGRAVAFASGFGFRPTAERRPMRVASEADGEEEIAMDLPVDQGVRGNAFRG